MAQYIYVMKNLGKSFAGGRTILQDVTLSFLPGAKIGVLGPNGAGKSTLLKIMAGWDKEFTGEAWAAEGARVGYLPQEPRLEEDKTVHENVMEGLGETKAKIERYNEISGLMADPDQDMDALLAEMGQLQEEIDAVEGWEIDSHVQMAMEALRCPPGDTPVTHLSGGERRRVALCRLLLEKPDLLLLDEPTNHLDAESVAWLQNHLAQYPGTVVMVTHDRYFLDNVTGWILEIDRGHAIPYEGNYSTYLEQKEKRLKQESREEKARHRTLEREREWISASPKARQAKSKARINAYEELMAEHQNIQPGQAQIIIPTPPRLGETVVIAEHLRKGFEDRLLIDALNFKLPRGGICGIIGPNGAGKTTLFKMMTGSEKPDDGTIELGDSVKLGYVDQSRDNLNPDNNVWEEISGGHDMIDLGKRQMQSRAYVAAFNFKGPDQQKKVGQLSGGERNRVHLAKMLQQGANCLLLDEPTNDLDTETLAALEDAITDFPGSALIISHDRWFLNRICTHILAFEGNSHVEFFEGNYEDYIEDKKRRLGVEEIIPKRVQYKPLRRAG